MQPIRKVFPLEVAQSGRHLYVVVVEQVLTDRTVVDARGHSHRVEAREPVVVRVERQPHRLERVRENGRDPTVARPALLDPLLGDEAERLPKRVDVRDRRRVVVRALLAQ